MAAAYADYFRAYITAGIAAELLDPELGPLRPCPARRSAEAGARPAIRLSRPADALRSLLSCMCAAPASSCRRRSSCALRWASRCARSTARRRPSSSTICSRPSPSWRSTPTLFNAGTLRPQLSSCFLTTVPDDLDGIFKCVQDNALLAKYSGGLGNDWTRVRGLGAHIKGTNGESQGVVPFLKVANDTAIAVNQGGKRKGAVCAYLETWHIDIEEFLDLRKNTGDDRRRTHDMNTANWVPDLFMQRVEADGEWTLFSPDETPDLHDLYGPAFKTAYEAYEAKAERGEIKVFKRVRAVDLWRRMLTMLFETGHPWITFKDPCNIRSPQSHAGVVHSSNLCTEITLNTSDDEVAVCNLGSINLAAHVDRDGLDRDAARRARSRPRCGCSTMSSTSISTPSRKRAAPTCGIVRSGSALMGFQDALQTLRLPYASEEAVRFRRRKHGGDLLPRDLGLRRSRRRARALSELRRLALVEGHPADRFHRACWPRRAASSTSTGRRRLDWSALRERVRTVGMRNSNSMAIAPTATISNICGVCQSIEPAYQNLFVKSNMSGDFTVVNAALVRDLKARGLWDEVMIVDLKYFDGARRPHRPRAGRPEGALRDRLRDRLAHG